MSQEGPNAVSSNESGEKKRFGEVLFCIVFTGFLEHQASQESPKTAKKPPTTSSGSLKEPIKNGLNFVFQSCPKSDPKSDP